MSAVLEREQLRQRSDYTYKFNSKTGRHGWLRLTPAYSLKIVEELIVGHEQAKRIFDPFCGTGTTVLSATYHGHEGVTTDINPFLVWLAQAKPHITLLNKSPQRGRPVYSRLTWLETKALNLYPHHLSTI